VEGGWGVGARPGKLRESVGEVNLDVLEIVCSKAAANVPLPGGPAGCS
jgi:hypothetical protein